MSYKVVMNTSRGEIVMTGDHAREFIRKLEHPTEEEKQQSKDMLAKCRELAKSITSRIK